jgi:flavorubredoxin
MSGNEPMSTTAPRPRALVVYESMFGNTEAIAHAIAEGLSPHVAVELVEVSAAPTTLRDVDLLVAGGPTHAFELSRRSTREAATEQAPAGLVSSGNGLREWLDAVHDDAATTLTATFDTRVNRPRVAGSAASAASRRLRRIGFRRADGPKSFYVTGMIGPLVEGETERARRWGAQLGSCLALVAA